ncbi:MAG TPA: FAD-dependent oxidoreductase [Candidatus Limnocylindria bacterium]|nr:FAD-dependent oxidoreductase [Candidatus Limnocylindria bacterium]
MAAYDVGIIGGGIVGTSAAWLLARAGASVVLLERDELAAGASGRNSGAVQHPLDALPATLHRTTLELYRELSELDGRFALPSQPAGLLIVGDDQDAVRAATKAMAGRAPEVAARFVPPDELRRLEPALAGGLSACRLQTGYPVAPAAATLAFARLAAGAGAQMRTGILARPWIESGRVVGVDLDSGERLPCASVLLAAGPWTAELLGEWAVAPPVSPLWGAVVTVDLERPPGHILEELGIGDLGAGGSLLFSLVTAGGSSGLGSVFAREQPQPARIEPALLERGARFLPALAGTRSLGLRLCARPVTADGRPLVGAVPGVAGLYVCAGHGAWGISTGPGSVRLVVEQLLAGRSPGLDALPELSPARFAH